MRRFLRNRLTPEQRQLVSRGREQTRLLCARALHPVAEGANQIALRTGLVFAQRPSAAEVVERYTNGWLLFGQTGGRFEWRHYGTRAVITSSTAVVPKRVERMIRKLDLDVRFVEDPEQIIEACRVNRSGWLTPEVTEIYREVRELGFVSAVGAYQDGVLVGGHWGLAVGGTFGGMSMFHTVDNAGTVVLAALCDAVRLGQLSMLDCGAINDNFRRYGAYEVSTPEFCAKVWSGIGNRAGSPPPGLLRGDPDG